MQRKMFALTVQVPWPWAMMHAGKDRENRGRGPDYRLQPGDVFLIHAGKSLQSFHQVEMWNDWPPAMTPMVRHVADLIGDGLEPPFLGYPACTAVYDGCTMDLDSEWQIPGQVGWKLKDVVPVSDWVKLQVGVLRGVPGLFELETFHVGLLLGDRSRQQTIFKKTGRFDPASEP